MFRVLVDALWAVFARLFWCDLKIITNSELETFRSENKQKEKFVNSRQCQQRLARKSNRDFHLIDIVLKINYVVYANLTERRKEEKIRLRILFKKHSAAII